MAPLLASQVERTDDCRSWPGSHRQNAELCPPKTQSEIGLVAGIRETTRLWRKHGLDYDQTKYVVEHVRRDLALAAPRGRRRSVDRLDRVEVERLIQTAYRTRSRHGLMIKTLFLTGARVSEFVPGQSRGSAPRQQPASVAANRELRTMPGVSLWELLDGLEAVYGLPQPPPTSDPFELVIWENIAYLADDAARSVAFATLREHVGTEPAQILSAPSDVLQRIGGAGILPAASASKLRTAAAIALERFSGDLGHLGQLPLAAARRVLKTFPSIGEPGADKILMLARLHPVLALDSNGLRVMIRLGYGRETKDYSATYRSVLAAVQPELTNKTFDWLIRAHLLLRRHGQEVCRRNSPACHLCPLTATCAYYQRSH